MLKLILLITTFFIFIIGCSTTTQTAGNTVLTLDINQIKLNISNQEQIAYLGIENSAKNFYFRNIKSDIIIIDLFSMYCSYCQKNAALFNELFHKIKNSDLSYSVKFIGIGFGNSEFEANLFKKKYDIPFPVFPDPKFKISDNLNIDVVPHFAVLKRDTNDNFVMIYRNQGDIFKLEKFIFEQLN